MLQMYSILLYITQTTSFYNSIVYVILLSLLMISNIIID